MRFQDIEMLGDPVGIPSESEILDAESKIGTNFPADYSAYMTRLGMGTVSNRVVIYHPRFVLFEKLVMWPNYVEHYWEELYKGSKFAVEKNEALACIPIGRTTSSDLLVFRRNPTCQILALARDSDQLYAIGSTILEAVEWFCTTEKLNILPIRARQFRPDKSYQRRLNLATNELNMLRDSEGHDS